MVSWVDYAWINKMSICPMPSSVHFLWIGNKLICIIYG